MFRVVAVDATTANELEPLGSKRKFWYRDGERRMLFKAENRGTGEDWAEKIACELAALLGLPHIHYELAVEAISQTPGVVCENCASPPFSLVLGNQLLFARDPAYPADEGNKYKVREHTVDAVADVLRDLELPPREWLAKLPTGIESALDVFIGYVMLDAFIANQDRHHENWGALRDATADYLAPTFDHGGSLARNVSDRERQDRLTTADQQRRIPHFARRARSAFYVGATTNRPLTTIAAWNRFSGLSPNAGTIWLRQLGKIEREVIDDLLSRVPENRMSPVRREFTCALLVENQRRLLAGEME